MIKKYLYLLLFTTTILQTMEKEITHWFDLPPEVITKIFACADLATKSKIYFFLREKFLANKSPIKREELLNHSPLVLSRKQNMHLLIEAAKNSTQENFMRFLNDAKYCDHDIFHTVLNIFPDNSEELELLRLYSKWKNKGLLEQLVPHIMNVYKGGNEIPILYAANYQDKYPKKESDLTPLQITISLEHDTIAELFLMQGVDLADIPDPMHHANLLLHAITENNLKISMLILAYKKINLDELWIDDLLPLHYAAQEGKLAMLQLLIAHGATINLAGMKGKTALSWAIYNKHDDIIRFLLSEPHIKISEDDNSKLIKAGYLLKPMNCNCQAKQNAITELCTIL